MELREELVTAGETASASLKNDELCTAGDGASLESAPPALPADE